MSEEGDYISIEESVSELGDEGDDSESELSDPHQTLIVDKSISKSRDQVQVSEPAASKSLHGQIKLVEEDEIKRDVEIQRLSRAPRYFDDDLLLQDTARCFNCGRIGHRSANCEYGKREKPCYLCAQFGHESRECPAQLCFRCGRPGHISRNCSSTLSSWEQSLGRCLRCASPSCACADKGDYFRYEGGCTERYDPTDLANCKCYVCGKWGHLSCIKTPEVPAQVSCYSCGSCLHLGENCQRESRSHLAAERAGDSRKAQREREAEIERAQERAAASRRGGGGYQNDHTSFKRQRRDEEEDRPRNPYYNQAPPPPPPPQQQQQHYAYQQYQYAQASNPYANPYQMAGYPQFAPQQPAQGFVFSSLPNQNQGGHGQYYGSRDSQSRGSNYQQSYQQRTNYGRHAQPNEGRRR